MIYSYRSLGSLRCNQVTIFDLLYRYVGTYGSRVWAEKVEIFQINVSTYRIIEKELASRKVCFLP